MKFGINSFFLVNALDHVYSEFDLTSVSQIIGRNNLGKTSLIRCLKFALIDNLSTGLHFGAYSWENTLNYYFPSTSRGNAWIVFRAYSSTRGQVTIAVTRSDTEKNIVRVVINGALGLDDFVESREDGGQIRKYSRTLAQLREYLMVERGLNADDVLVIRDAKEYREMLSDDNLSKHRGLGILPLRSKGGTDFSQFRFLMSKALDVNNYDLKNIKQALLQISDIKPADARLNFTGDTDTKQRFVANLGDRSEAMLALKLLPSFEVIKEASERAFSASKEIACLAKTHRAALSMRVGALEADIRFKDERLAELVEQKSGFDAQIEQSKREADEVKSQIARNEEIVSRHAQEVTSIESQIAQSLDQRSAEDLEAAIAAVHVRLHGAQSAVSPEAAARDVRDLEQQVSATQRSLEHLRSGHESFGAYLHKNYGANVYATLSSVLSPSVLSMQAKDVVSNESLLSLIDQAGVGDEVNLELLRATVVQGHLDHQPLGEEELQDQLSSLMTRLKSARAALADMDAVQSMRDEVVRLQELRDVRKRLAVLEGEQEKLRVAQAAQAIEDLRVKAADCEKVISRLDVMRGKVEDARRVLMVRNDAKLLASMKAALDGMTIDESRHAEGGNGCDLISSELGNEEYLDAYTASRTKLDERYRMAVGAMIKARDKSSSDYSALIGRLTGDASMSVISFDRPWLPDSELMIKLSDVIGNSKTRLEAANRMLSHLLVEQSHLASEFVRRLDQISKTVSLLSSKLKALRISNLADLGIDFVRNEAQLEKLHKLVSAGGTIDSVMEGGAMIDGKSVFDYFHDMLDSGSSIYHLEDMFSLNIYSVNHAGAKAHGSSSSATGSQGTVTMIQILLSVLLVGRLFDSSLVHDYVVPAYVDEAAQIDKDNLNTLTRCMLDNGFVTAFAHPSDFVLPMYGTYNVYEMRYVKSKGANYSYISMVGRKLTDKRIAPSQEVEDEREAQLA